MKMQKRQFRIGELAKKLNVEKFVIRFWEKEFALKTDRSPGGQRFYTNEDFQQFKLIKDLLYEQGFTIAGAKKYINRPQTETTIVASQKTTLEPEKKQEISQQILHLKKQLLKLQELL